MYLNNLGTELKLFKLVRLYRGMNENFREFNITHRNNSLLIAWNYFRSNLCSVAIMVYLF